MQSITGRDARTVLTDPAFEVPPVPLAAAGIAGLRATVARFSSGDVHRRRRALAVAILAEIPPETLRPSGGAHPVTVLAAAMGCTEPVADLVRDVAQAYQPGTGDATRADAAVDRLVEIFGGVLDEPAAARIGLLVQACAATEVLIERARHAPVEEVLREHPPVPATRRRAIARTVAGGVTVEAGEVVRVDLSGGLAFSAGPHECPGAAHARALAQRPGA